MRTFATSVTDLRQEFADDFDTFPYECGWADEAIYFVTAEDQTPADAQIDLRVQLSADGIRWLDEGTTLSLTGPDSTFARLTHFGGFLRLAGTITNATPDPDPAAPNPNPNPHCTLTIRLVLKG